MFEHLSAAVDAGRSAQNPMKDFEDWEIYADFYDRQDWTGLVVYCKKEVAFNPNDLHAVERLVSAYHLNGDYEKAIEFASQIYRQYPDISAFQDMILDALFALGKTEEDFDWFEYPTVIQLSFDVANLCYDYLRPKRKPRDLHDLCLELQKHGYLAFSEHELLDYLELDSRFIVNGNNPFIIKISVHKEIQEYNKKDIRKTNDLEQKNE